MLNYYTRKVRKITAHSPQIVEPLATFLAHIFTILEKESFELSGAFTALRGHFNLCPNRQLDNVSFTFRSKVS